MSEETTTAAFSGTLAMPRGLYAITPECEGQVLDDFAQGALEGGAVMVQYRAKDKPAHILMDNAIRLAALCRNHGALLIINDFCELCLPSQAAGVHLGKDDLSVAKARALLGADVLIGASAYNELDRALALEQAGADYVALGSFYPSPTKPQAVRATPALLEEARQALAGPLCVIGGIGIAEAGALAALGADLIAVSSGLLQAGKSRAAIAATAQHFVAAIASGRDQARPPQATLNQDICHDQQ
jgi:thiamine-phosphate pyrophosphorylase